MPARGSFAPPMAKVATGPRVCVADDVEGSNQATALNYAEARAEAGKLARVATMSSNDTSGRPIIVNEAIDHYETDLILRGANKANACQLRVHMQPRLGVKPAALQTDSDLRNWRNNLVTVAAARRS